MNLLKKMKRYHSHQPQVMRNHEDRTGFAIVVREKPGRIDENHRMDCLYRLQAGGAHGILEDDDSMTGGRHDVMESSSPPVKALRMRPMGPEAVATPSI
jgi:hypothetical protein